MGRSQARSRFRGCGLPGTTGRIKTLGDAAPPMLRPTPAWVCLFQTSLKVRTELFERPKTNSLPNFAHSVKVKVDVVKGVKDG